MFRTSLISCFRRPTPFHPGIFTFRPLRYFACSFDLSILLILYIRSRVHVHWQCGCRIPPASPSSAISSSRVIRAIIHGVRSSRRNQTQTKSNFFLCILPCSLQESRSILNFSARPLLMPLFAYRSTLAFSLQSDNSPCFTLESSCVRGGGCGGSR